MTLHDRRRRRHFGGVVALVAIVFSHVASAAVITVPADQPTIGAAIAAANPGDVIAIAPGVYGLMGSMDLSGISGSLTIRSVDPGDPARVAGGRGV